MTGRTHPQRAKWVGVCGAILALGCAPGSPQPDAATDASVETCLVALRLGDDNAVFAANEPVRLEGTGVPLPVADGFPCLRGPTLVRWSARDGRFTRDAGTFTVALDGLDDRPALIATIREPGIYLAVADAGFIDGYEWFVGARVSRPLTTLPRVCHFLQPLSAGGWICDGAMLSADAGLVAVADRWLDTAEGLLRFQAGAVELLRRSVADAGVLLTSVPSITAWSADDTGVSIATDSHFVLCDFDAGCVDGGLIRYDGQPRIPGFADDGGVVFLARVDAQTYFARRFWNRPVCRIPERVCEPLVDTNSAGYFDRVARTLTAVGSIFTLERPVTTLYTFAWDAGWEDALVQSLPYQWRRTPTPSTETRARVAATGPSGTLIANTDPRRPELELYAERDLPVGTSSSLVWFLDEDAGVTRVYESPRLP